MAIPQEMDTMKVKVAKWGNSLGLRLPKSAAESAGVRVGTELDLTVDGGGFRLRSLGKTSAQLLDEMLADMKRLGPEAEPETVAWGPDRGSEMIDDDYARGILVEGPDGAPVRADGTPTRHVGDIAWVDLDDTRGSEQSGRRPALVLTPLSFHQMSRRAIICPITSKIRQWPTSVALPQGLKIAGMILVDQVRSPRSMERT
eukprot:gene12173-16238_t